MVRKHFQPRARRLLFCTLYSSAKIPSVQADVMFVRLKQCYFDNPACALSTICAFTSSPGSDPAASTQAPRLTSANFPTSARTTTPCSHASPSISVSRRSDTEGPEMPSGARRQIELERLNSLEVVSRLLTRLPDAPTRISKCKMAYFSFSLFFSSLPPPISVETLACTQGPT